MGFIAVSLEPGARPVNAFRERQKSGMQFALARSILLDPLHVRAVPSTVFLNRQGTLEAAVTGPLTPQALRQRILEIAPQEAR